MATDSQPTMTAKQRKTLNDAVALIIELTPANATWFFDVRSDFGGCASVTYFTSNKTQHYPIFGETFADRIEEAIRLQRLEDGDQEGVRARRIARLQEELAKLTEKAA